ncbi:MAG: TonB-dependent receptor [Bacteroidales bacterium]|nr:TonB-dependent receptor [Bacteroidales bacterium]
MKKPIFTFFLLLVSFTSALAQFNIKGTIRDTEGEPLAGVTVLISGTNTAVASNLDGVYSIIAPSPDVEMQFISIGFITQNVRIDNRTLIDVILKEDTQRLDEIVVIGYGTAKRSDLTGSVASVKLSKEQAAIVSSPDVMLRGKAAGVQVTSGNSAPGGAVNVRIRGTATLNGNSEPLYVVDGVIMDSSMEDVGSTMSGGTQGSSTRQEVQNGLTSINPQDIESIEILKDASATAIYGSRGTNGVVLITTKKGSSEKARIIFNSLLDAGSVYEFIPVLSGKEYVDFINEKSSTPVYDGSENLDYVNWQERLTRTAISQQYRISASGTVNKANYYVAGGYLNNQGVVKTTGLNQFDLRANVSYDLTSRLKLTARYNTIRRVNNMTTGTDNMGSLNSSMIRQMVNQPPLLNLDDLEDEYKYSPEAWLTDYIDKSTEFRNISSIALDYKINDVFTFRIFGGYDNRNKERARWYGKNTYTGATANGQLGIALLQTESINSEAMLYFDKSFGDHHLSGTVGVTYDYKTSKQYQMVNENFFTEALGIYGMGYGDNSYPNGASYYNYQLFSGLGRLNYSFKNKYLLTVTGRLDGSSRFAKNNRFSLFSSVAGAWRIDKEKFMSGITSVSNLKLRAGWGQTGNQAIDPFSTKDVYTNGYYGTHEGSIMVAMYPGSIANTALVWETTEQTNIGLDISLFSNRFNFSADAYYKVTDGMLQEIDAPLSSGFPTIAVNLGSMSNKGLEFSMDGYIINTNDFSWNIGGNISINRNQIISLGLEPSVFGTQEMVAYLGSNIASDADLATAANIFIEGSPIGMFWGYQTDGIYQNEAEASQYAYSGVARQAGDVRFVDQNGDNEINALDKVVIGNPNPDFTYGMNTTFTYKKLSLNLFFYGSYGNDILNANLIKETSSHTSNNIRREAYIQAWRETAPGNTYPRLGYRFQEVSDRFIEDGSFFRLSSLTFSYRIPFERVNWLNSIDLSITGHNLFTITKYSGYNPEVNSFSNDPTRIGIDFGGYPCTKSVSFGLSLTF